MNAQRVGRVAHQAVEDRAERLGRGEAHVLVGLVDDQLHRRELGGRDRRELGGERRDPRLELRERDRLVDQPDVGGLAPRQRPAGQRVELGARRGRAGRSTCPTGTRPTCASTACRSAASSEAIDEVGAEREVAAAADAPAVDLGDHRLRRAPDAHELLRRRDTAARSRRRSPCPDPSSPSVVIASSQCLEAAAEVVAAAERAAGAAQRRSPAPPGRARPAPTAASTSSGIGGTIVLSCSGRFSVIVATGPATA